jgi:hypothetical protein
MSMQEGLELAAVQMPPAPFFRMIVERPFSPAFRAGPLDSLRMLNPNVDPRPKAQKQALGLYASVLGQNTRRVGGRTLPGQEENNENSM